MVELNEQMETMGKAMDNNKTDCCVCTALCLQGEAIRVTMPAPLRWCHGCVPGNANQTLE